MFTRVCSTCLWKKTFIAFALSVIILCFSVTRVLAVGPAKPDEIERYKADGTFESRLQRMLELGNNKFSPYLIEKFKVKRQMMLLKSRGVPRNLVEPLAATLPPGVNPGLPASGSPKIFALLLSFNDYPNTLTTSAVDAALFGDGNPANYPYESLANFYERSSYGLLDIGGSTLGWYQTSYDRSAVTQDGAGRDAVIKEALTYYDGLGHDFSQYDNDGDGDIEYFIVMWTGPDGGWGSFWWRYKAGFSDPAFTLDGKTLVGYSWQEESDHPGSVIHETGHGLGLPDLYDYDNTIGPDGGAGGLDVMNSYKYDINCFFKWMLDWLTPTLVAGGREVHTLEPSATSRDALLIWPGIGLGNIFSEFFMVQNRQDVGNDTADWFVPDGYVIWHVDSTLDAAGTNFAYNNSNTAHKLMRLMEADGLEEIEASGCGSGSTCPVANAGDLYGPGDEITHVSSPSSDKYDGADSCVRVWSIEKLGTDPGASISASFSTICNLPPTCDANGPHLAECSGATTDVMLDGAGCSDPDPGDTLSYSWLSDCPGAILDGAANVEPTLTVDTSPGCSVDCSVYLTVSDLVGDLDTCSTTVTIEDTLAPALTCPADMTIECDESTDPANTGMATATDDCDTSPPTITYSDVVVPGVCPVTSVITRTWRATDSCGNSESCDQVITLVDTTPPVIQCNAPITITPPDAAISFMATATDNCDGDPSVEIIDYRCYKITRWGKIVDKSESCMVDVAGDTISILDSGGAGDIFRWTVKATDTCGNASQQQCTTVVTRPSKP